MKPLVRATPDADHGFRRVRTVTGFRYVDAHGTPASSTSLSRIRALAIPPAWSNVWVAATQRGSIQAIGTDTAGRRQYIYHVEWRRREDRKKFARALELAASLPRARGYVTRALRHDDPDRERALAVAFRLLDEAALRVGSRRYLTRYGSRGLTTLRRQDAAVAGSLVRLTFAAKGGKHALYEIDDADLARVISELATGRRQAPLLWYRKGRRQIAITAADLNRHIRLLTGGAFSAKDFRTLRGTILAAEALARAGVADSTGRRRHAEAMACSAAARALKNTPSVARASYIDPRVFTRYKRGETLDLAITPERAIVKLLAAESQPGIGAAAGRRH